ncbi:MAG: hypothetical protein IJO29_01010 [Oscillospiraceae bacterium]|nr:hypothetical protein [Oscillospiraceae bacterium]
MKFKRILSVIISLSVAVSALTFNTSAHTGDYFSGTYLSTSPCNQSSLGFVVYSSAQTTLLNYNDVYSKAFAWDGITDNVNIRIAMYSSGMPTSTFYGVIGKDLGTETLGRITAYSSSGATVSIDSYWHSVSITMNTSDVFNNSSYPTQSAAKTFMHEVGHALKLAHPEQDSSLTGHTYEDGRPLAIMNQGFVEETYVPTTIATHDRQNLIAKWGE